MIWGILLAQQNKSMKVCVLSLMLQPSKRLEVSEFKINSGEVSVSSPSKLRTSVQEWLCDTIPGKIRITLYHTDTARDGLGENGPHRLRECC